MPSTHSYAGITASSPIQVKGDATIRSFAEARSFLEADLGGPPYKLHDEARVGKRATSVNLEVLEVDGAGRPMSIAVRAYDTHVVVYRHDETFTTNSGGYLTPTTCTRIQQFTPDWADYVGVDSRNLHVAGFYGDRHANRFTVAEPGVVGVEIKAPRLKRVASKTPYGRISWKIDSSGHVFSFNDDHPKEFVFPLLDYEAIGRNGDFSGPLRYDLERRPFEHYELRGLQGLAKLDVPLNLANLHREKWGMPPIQVIDAG